MLENNHFFKNRQMMSNYTTTQHPPQYLRDKVEQKLPIDASFFNKAVNKPPLFYKALYGYLLILCFGLGMSSATAQQGVTYDYVNFYPDGSNLFNFQVLVTLGDAAENKVTSVCGNTPKGSYRATTLIDPIPGDYLQEVTAIPLSQYAVVKRGKPFTLTFNGYKSILTSTARVYIGSENEPTRLIGTYNGALGNIFQTLTPLFDKGASKAWIVIEGNVDGFNTTRLVIPFVCGRS